MSERDRQDSPKILTINTRGMVCPYPSFETTKAYSRITSGQTLVVNGDDDDVLCSVARALTFRKIQYQVSKHGTQWTIVIHKP